MTPAARGCPDAKKKQKRDRSLHQGILNMGEQAVTTLFFFSFKILFIYFLDRVEGKEKEKERNIMGGCLSRAPYWGPGPQPRRAPRLGIELGTLRFPGRHSIHGATPARADFYKCSVWKGALWIGWVS